MEKLMMYLAAHFLGDFAFQAEWMYRGKGKSWLINFCHASVYASVFVALAHTSVLASMIIFASHFLLDALKARWKIVPSVWIDQLLHFLVIVIILWLRV